MNRLWMLLSEYKQFFDNGHEKTTGALAEFENQITGLGNETYGVVYKFLIFVSRFIFRIASPREDAKAKGYVQTTLVVTFLISMITVLFETIMILADVL